MDQREAPEGEGGSTKKKKGGFEGLWPFQSTVSTAIISNDEKHVLNHGLKFVQ